MLKFFIICFSILISFKAFAHPHVWVATDIKMLAKDNKLIGFNINWQFDEMYSSAFMMDADKNGDNVLDILEQTAIEADVYKNTISTIKPFIMLKIKNMNPNAFKIEDLAIKYNPDLEKVIYNFNIILNESQNLQGNYKVAVVDKEFYVDFEQSYDFIAPNNCSVDLTEDVQELIYDGLIAPETYKVKCN